MRNLWTLYRKELSGTKSDFLLIAALVLAWEVFLATRQGRWPAELVFGLSFLPLAIFPLWALIGGVQSLRREWNENTVYVLLSLPTRGWMIAGAKALALITELTLHTLLVPALALTLAGGGGSSVLPGSEMGRAALLSVTANGLVFYWVTLVLVVVVGQFCYVASSTFDRFQWLAGAWILLVSVYVLTRGAQLASPAFSWIPDLPLRTYSEVNGIPSVGIAFVDAAPLVATLVLAAAMFLGTSLLIEKSVEV